jgi:hypothetical protein
MSTTILTAIIGASFLITGSYAIAQEDRPPPKTGVPSQDFTVGKPTQKVTPREMKETIRPDGARSIVTGQTRESNGAIDPNRHSHSVVRDGKVVSSRTAGMERGTTIPVGESGKTLGRASSSGSTSPPSGPGSPRTFPSDVRGPERAAGVFGGGTGGGKPQKKQSE